MIGRKAFFAVVGGLALSFGSASAAEVDPVFQTFGDLARATFGGAGIPTDPTAFSTFTAANGDRLTLGLAATPRFFNDPLGNDGSGTYTAKAGANNGGPGSTSTLIGAKWNFSFFIEVEDNGGGSTSDDFGITLLYDFDPVAGTDETQHGIINFAGANLTLIEGSENFNFDFLAGVPPLPFITPPPGAFDPDAVGEYSLALRSNLGDVAINVLVQPIPLPATAFMLAGAIGLLGFAARKRKA